VPSVPVDYENESNVQRDVTLSTKAILPTAADACINATGVSTNPSTIVGNPNILQAQDPPLVTVGLKTRQRTSEQSLSLFKYIRPWR
jgi:hypothetical protein